MFYSKYKNNCHIVDNISSLKINDLKEKDNVILLNGTDIITTTNLVLDKIHYGGKIYDFTVNNNLISNQVNFYSDTTSWSNNTSYGQDILRMYNNNGSLLPMCNTKNRTSDFGEDGFHILSKALKNYVNKHKGQIYANDICTSLENDKKHLNNLYTYLTLPLDNKSFMILCRSFTISNKKRFYKNDYVIFCDYPTQHFKNKLNNEFIEFFYFNSFLNTYYANNLGESFQKIKYTIGKNKYTEFFDEAYNASTYCLDIESYFKDENREETVDKISKFFNKKLFKNNDFDLRSQYNPVFNHKSGIASYLFNFDISVTYKGEIINCGNGCGSEFDDVTVHTKEGSYTIKRPDVMKKNKKLQILYKIAYDIAEFTKVKNGIDPVTGNHYNYWKPKNEDIIYKDCKSIIVGGNYKTYYAKKYGYFIRVYNAEAQEIEERYKTIQKLSGK